MATHEPFDARNVASLDRARSFRHVGLAGPRADCGKDAFDMDGKEIRSSWQVDSKSDGPKILARDARTACSLALRKRCIKAHQIDTLRLTYRARYLFINVPLTIRGPHPVGSLQGVEEVLQAITLD